MINKMPFDNDLSSLKRQLDDLYGEIDQAVKCSYDSGYEVAKETLDRKDLEFEFKKYFGFFDNRAELYITYILAKLGAE